jgi:hypothetical protein
MRAARGLHVRAAYSCKPYSHHEAVCALPILSRTVIFELRCGLSCALCAQAISSK